MYVARNDPEGVPETTPGPNGDGLVVMSIDPAVSGDQGAVPISVPSNGLIVARSTSAGAAGSDFREWDGLRCPSGDPRGLLNTGHE
jgi:hypothetical protein